MNTVKKEPVPLQVSEKVLQQCNEATMSSLRPAQPAGKTSLLEAADDAPLPMRERAASDGIVLNGYMGAPKGACGMKAADNTLPGKRERVASDGTDSTASGDPAFISEYEEGLVAPVRRIGSACHRKTGDEGVCSRATNATVSTTTSSWMKPPTVRVGQTVTTVHGLKGRVVIIEGDEVQIAVPGFIARPLVSISDIVVRKVIFLGGYGFNSIKHPKRIFCSCLVRGDSGSEVRTPSELAGKEAKWQHQVDVVGYKPGDSFTVRLWGKDSKAQSDRLLGEALLPAAMALHGGFDTQLQLTLGGKCLQVYLSVMVVSVDTSTDFENDEAGHCEAPDAKVTVTSVDMPHKGGDIEDDNAGPCEGPGTEAMVTSGAGPDSRDDDSTSIVSI